MRKSLGTIMALALSVCLVLPGCTKKDEVKPTKNLIVMISDGTSEGLFSTTRWFKQYTDPQEDLSSLAIDPYLCGLVRVFNSDAPIAESSGSMSDYMTGVVTQGRDLSVYPQSNAPFNLIPIDESREWQPQTTLAEAARITKGKSVGVVVTCTFHDATPAATSSHTVERGSTHDVARQMASQGLDVLFGGGMKAIDSDVEEILKEKGITYIQKDVNAFRNHQDGKVWAIFNDDHLLYELDRDDSEPSLTEMSMKAIELLSKNKNGFFLMIEGSKVDKAAHSKDPIGTITEFIEFNNAFQAVVDWAKKDGNTTVVAMADHGTSGITMGDAHYNNYTKQPIDSMYVNLVKYKATGDKLYRLISKCEPDQIKPIFKQWTGIDLNDREYNALLTHKGIPVRDYMNSAREGNLSGEINAILTGHTHIGFVSGNHTGEDVFMAVYNPRDQRPHGIIKNYELNRYMRKVLGLKEDMEVTTDKLFVPQYDLFYGYDWKVVREGRNDPDLVVKSGDKVLVVPANRSYYYVGDLSGGQVDKSKLERKDLSSVAIWIRENNNFYLPATIKNELPVPAKVQHGDVPVYAWQGLPKDATPESTLALFKDLKSHGVSGVCISAGTDLEKIAMAAAAAKQVGLEYHAWVSVMTQPGMPHSWYAVNRLGQSADTDPVYVDYYKFLDPRNPQVRKWAVETMGKIADIPGVDYVQLDYIRYPDVILARGLWPKYGVDQHSEYAPADYCYCKDCVEGFLKLTGIDVTKSRRNFANPRWAQYRCDAVTELVQMIAEEVHAKGKKLSADVFPGPRSYAKGMVRQDWDKWPLDKVFPMNYNDFYLGGTQWIGKVCREEVGSVDIPVYSGLFICKDWQNKDKVVDPEYSGLVPSEMEDAVILSMKAGCEGICLFTPGSMTQDHWDALDAALKKWKEI